MAAFAAPPGHPAHNQIMALCALVDAPVAIKAQDAGLKVRETDRQNTITQPPLSLSLSLSLFADRQQRATPSSSPAKTITEQQDPTLTTADGARITGTAEIARHGESIH
jgi:hypothetical protein